MIYTVVKKKPPYIHVVSSSAVSAAADILRPFPSGRKKQEPSNVHLVHMYQQLGGVQTVYKPKAER